VLLVDDVAWVSAALDTRVARINLASASVHNIEVPCGGTGALAHDDGNKRVLIACKNDDQLVAVSDDGALLGTAALAGHPSALAVRGDAIDIATDRAPAALVHATLTADGRSFLTDLHASALAHDGHGPASSVVAEQSAGLAFVGDSAVAVYQTADHDDRAQPAAQGGYGSVVDGSPRIEPRLSAPCPAHPAVFDGSPRAFSGPSALLALADNRVAVAARFTDSVAIVDCSGNSDGKSAWRGTLRTGRGPRGLALSADGKTLFVDAGFDLAIDRVAVDDVVAAGALGQAAQPALAVARALGASRLSDAARHGEALFNDATNTHLTPSGVVTCATCHPAGGEDGLVWFLHTPHLDAKVRRTQPAWSARPSNAPFHWDGAFATAQDLERSTIEELLEGDALLVNLDDIAAYLAEASPPPPRPASSLDGARVSHGRDLFEGVAHCSDCHAGDLFADELRHDVLAHSSDIDVNIAGGSRTPSLLGVRARAPFLHDGSAATLADRLANNPGDIHGITSALSAIDTADLIAYLESL
jgi:mono/diheme cytochrome c family protein